MNMSLTHRYLVYISIGLAAFALLIYGLGSVLVPFIISALLAYLGDPLADRLEDIGASRSLAVVIVFSFLSMVLLAAFLLLAPLLSEQLARLMGRLPTWFAEAESFLVPRLQEFGILKGGLADTSWKDIVADYWQQGGNFALNTAKKITSSGAALIGLVTNIILIPVLTFYLLRDWDLLVAKFRNLLPKPFKPTVMQVTDECHEVLSSFFRGQFIVMITLAVFYSAALGVIGLDVALLIGTIAGLANIIPYMGFVVGIVCALLAAWMEFHAWLPLLHVVIIFGVGQVIEGMFLTPLLVGDKIGLHPVAVIFALMAGGKLAGFTGLLVALPVAAVLMVMIRLLIKKYQLSDLYFGEENIDTYDKNNPVVADDVVPMLGEPKNVASLMDDDIDSVFFEDALWQQPVKDTNNT